jgi:hypothetical protein
MARVRTQLRSPGQRESATLEAADIRMDLRTRRACSATDTTSS